MTSEFPWHDVLNPLMAGDDLSIAEEDTADPEDGGVSDTVSDSAVSDSSVSDSAVPDSEAPDDA